MKSPAELLDTLRRYESAESAITVWQEAAAAVRAYREVMQAALDCARAEMQADGVLHSKFEHGSAGWTVPKSPRLNKERWAQVLGQDSQAAQQQEVADRAAQALTEYQQQAGCMELPEARFYIR